MIKLPNWQRRVTADVAVSHPASSKVISASCAPAARAPKTAASVRSRRVDGPHRSRHTDRGAANPQPHHQRVPPDMPVLANIMRRGARRLLVDAGILDGDMALIQRNETADTGDIVVALIDDEKRPETLPATWEPRSRSNLRILPMKLASCRRTGSRFRALIDCTGNIGAAVACARAGGFDVRQAGRSRDDIFGEEGRSVPVIH